MKAIIYESYGPPEVLKLSEVNKPLPKDNEVLIKIYATSVTQGDWRLRKPTPFMARLYNGLFKPKRINILGFELSGLIEAVGTNVSKFKVGDEVFAFTGFGFGAYAEYRCLPVDGNYKTGLIAIKPNNMSFNEAAVVPGGCLTAYSHINKFVLNKDSNILVYGASGSVGTFFVQLAKYYGANVTAVCGTSNVEMVKALGADLVIDYKKEDFRNSTEKYDLIFDAVNKINKSSCKNNLFNEGRYINVTSKTTIGDNDLDQIRKMVEESHIKAVIDKTYSCNDIIKAHQYVEQGHKSGNVSIVMDL